MKIYHSTIYSKFWLIVLLVIFNYAIDTSNLRSQSYGVISPADRFHPWISEINPAVISQQDARISLGLKVFQLGFLPKQSFGLKESHLNVSFPFYLPLGLGAGCDLHHYSAGSYSEIIGSIQLSRQIFDRFSIGFKIGFIRYDFNRSNFVLVDQADPLLSGSLGKNSLNFGFGGFWNPGRWTLGLGVDHANRPDMGLQTQAQLPMEIYGAAGYQVGKFIPSVLIQRDDLKFRYGIALSVKHDRVGTLRFSYQNDMPIKIEAQLNFVMNSSLHYGFDFPSAELSTVSMGSHEVIFNYIFDREPDIAQPEIILSSNSLNIFEERVIRSLPADLIPGELESIADLAPVYLDTKARNQNILVIPTGALNQYETEELQRQRYAKLAKYILKSLSDNPDVKLILNANNGSLADARAFKDYLIQAGIIHSSKINIAKVNSAGGAQLTGFQPGQLTKMNLASTLSEEKMELRFLVPGKTRQVRDWKLTINDVHHNIVKTFSGKDQLIDRLEWDWKNEIGEVVAPGQYKCFLQVKAKSGKEKHALSLPVQITRVKRTIVLRFSQDLETHANNLKR